MLVFFKLNLWLVILNYFQHMIFCKNLDWYFKDSFIYFFFFFFLELIVSREKDCFIYQPFIHLSFSSFDSESDGPAPAAAEKTRRKSRIKRRRGEKGLKLTILSVEAEGQEVECRLDIANKNSVTYKFTLENDKPEEIAENLVWLLYSLILMG